MAKPKLFIGSSKASIPVARLVANRLEGDDSAEVTVWDEGVFSLNKGFLEKLLAVLSEFDFAVLVWAPDDVTESKGESRASPRDNVIFECGLFMGAVGRERVFIVCDQSVSLKIPSDLAGITLATYDGSRIREQDAEPDPGPVAGETWQRRRQGRVHADHEPSRKRDVWLQHSAP